MTDEPVVSDRRRSTPPWAVVLIGVGLGLGAAGVGVLIEQPRLVTFGLIWAAAHLVGAALIYLVWRARSR